MRARVVVALFFVAISALGAEDPLSLEGPPPIPWHDQGPFARLFLQPAFESAERVAQGRCGGELRGMEASQFVKGGNGIWDATADFETTSARVSLRCGVGFGLDVELEIPILVDWAGFLDRPIAVIESALGARTDRRTQIVGETIYLLERTGGLSLARPHALWGLGDVSAAVGWGILRAAASTPGLTLRAVVKAPTGRRTQGSGETDFGLGLLSAWPLGRITLRAQLDAGFPTGLLAPLELPLQPYFTAQAGMGVEVDPRVALLLQGSVHTSPFRGTTLTMLQLPTFYAALGVMWRVTPATLLEFAAAENFFSYERGADFTLIAAVHWGQRL